MKILFMGDPHLWDRSILSRCDVSSDTCLQKIAWTGIVAQQEKVDYWVTPGDLFHNPVKSLAWMAKLKKFFINLRNEQIKVKGIYGNHDLWTGSYEDSQKTNLGHLFLDKYIDELTPWENPIAGLSAYGPQPKEGFSNPHVEVVVTHHFLEEQFFKDTLILTIDKLKKWYPNLKYLLPGHDHTVYETKTIQGVKVVRPGSLLRTSSAIENDRIPKIVIIDTESMTEKYINCPFSKPYAELFNVARRKAENAQEDAFEAFEENLKRGSAEADIETVFEEQLKLVEQEAVREYIRKDCIARGFIQV